MALVTSNSGELVLLDDMLKNGVSGNWKLKLYTNNYTPVAASVVGDFTECVASGYTEKTLTRSSWGSASTVSGAASSSYAQQTFSFSGSATIYGVYVTDNAETGLIYAEKFASPRSVVSGDSLLYTPKITLDAA